MPWLARPDGSEIFYESSGDGPPVVMSPNDIGVKRMLDPLVGELSQDHRVTRYDLRGYGRSSRRGPYDFETDVSDLEAVTEMAGGTAVAIAWGPGTNRAMRLAARRADLIGTVVGWGLFAQALLHKTEGLMGSGGATEVLVRLLEQNLHAGVRAYIGATTPEMEPDAVEQRVRSVVSYCSHDAVAARYRGHLELDPTDDARTLGDRLWLLCRPDNLLMAPPEQMKQSFPQANVVTLADGAISRPDLTAEVVRRITRR